MNVVDSLTHFPDAAAGLQLRKHRLGQQFDIENAGRFSIFRETIQTKPLDAEPVVLVIGFRLKLIKSITVLHWLFQRLCIITTPFWAGLSGFRTKLWMVNPTTQDYMGIYEWRGVDNAQGYIHFLVPILQIFAIHSSIWHRTYEHQDLEQYLQSRQVVEHDTIQS